jgi:hypothetical protein
MTVELYQRVALRCDLPEHNLKKGDVATVVDFVPHPEGGETGAVLEVFNALGESILTVVMPLSAVEPLRADAVLAVRPLESQKTAV